MRGAQTAAAEGNAADVAGALRELRARIAEYSRRADRVLADAGRPSELAELVERLTGVAASPGATGRLRDASFLAGDEHDEPEPDAESDAVPAPRRGRAATPPPQRGRAERSASVDERTDDGAARAAERRALVRAVADRERSLRTAERHVERARHTLGEATTKRELAAAAVARAQAELDDAEARAAAAAARVEELRAAADAEAQELTRLRARLDGIAT